MARVLIIKLGYTEVLGNEGGKLPSLGDVLRTTVILHLYKDDSVTWLVDEAAYPLLYDNKFIAQILIYNPKSIQQLKSEQFEIVINFEKDREICAFSDSIKTKRHYGFKFDNNTGAIKYYKNSKEAFRVSSDIHAKRNNKKCYQQIIMEIAGSKWKEQEYILGYRPKTELKYDIGLNWTVGSKWPNKAWPREYWDELAKKLEGNYTYCWQEGLNTIFEYIDWINSCRLLVTADSLGQHIALALKKKILILYGPTNPEETYLYGLGKKLLPMVDYDCVPCLETECNQKKSCMYFITPERVMVEIKNILGKD